MDGKPLKVVKKRGMVDWVAASTNSASAPYTIYDGTVAGTAVVNQKLAPSVHPVFKDGGVNWQSLGAFWMTDGTLTVKLACPAGTSVSVDAVKIIKAAPTRTAYDAIGNTLSITDGEHNSTTYAYDRLNRLKSETEAPYGTRSFQYDAGGNLTQETDRDGKVIQYVYDPVGRVVEERWMNGAAVVHTIHTWYNNVGQVRAVTESDTQDAAAGTNYEYDYRARLRRAGPRDADPPVGRRGGPKTGRLWLS